MEHISYVKNHNGTNYFFYIQNEILSDYLLGDKEVCVLI